MRERRGLPTSLDDGLRQRLREIVSEARRRAIEAEEAEIRIQPERPDLIDLRQRFGLSALALARELGVDPTRVRESEYDGKPYLTVADYRRVIEKLGLQPRATSSSPDRPSPEQLLALRRRAGLSGLEVARRMGVKPGAVAMLEKTLSANTRRNRVRIPRDDLIGRYLEALQSTTVAPPKPAPAGRPFRLEPKTTRELTRERYLKELRARQAVRELGEASALVGAGEAGYWYASY